jgi:hypothetical protein
MISMGYTIHDRENRVKKRLKKSPKIVEKTQKSAEIHPKIARNRRAFSACSRAPTHPGFLARQTTSDARGMTAGAVDQRKGVLRRGASGWHLGHASVPV